MTDLVIPLLFWSAQLLNLSKSWISRDIPILKGKARIDDIFVQRKMQLQYSVVSIEKEHVK